MATRLLACQCARLQLRFRNFQIKLTCFHLRRRKANANASAKRRSIHFRALTSCQDVGMFCRLLLLFHIYHTFFFSICMWNSLLLLHFCSFPLSNSKPASTKAPASNADTREYTRTPRCSLGVHICRGIKFRRQMSTLRLSQK